ncbi:hypothetical protein ABIG06_001596 [Bradyrhizobium sp. USDA 326]|uniref:DUF7662 domain-containing protein n=1 Tax=unclassified Bradyrhizobium TaxID=2631580 RepID=UPI0035170D32
MAIYNPLRDKLVANSSASLKMTFADIEMLIGRSLPKSAYEYDAWWANEDPVKTNHSHSLAWTVPGYQAEPNRLQPTVTFSAQGVAFSAQANAYEPGSNSRTEDAS